MASVLVIVVEAFASSSSFRFAISYLLLLLLLFEENDYLSFCSIGRMASFPPLNYFGFSRVAYGRGRFSFVLLPPKATISYLKVS